MNMHGLLFWLQAAFFILAVFLSYLYWIRPLIRERPQFKAFYDMTDNRWAALRLKLQGIKGRLMSGIAKAAAVIVLMHDQLIPYATGIDWTPITSKVPSWAWPVAAFAAFWFIGKARQWAEQRGDVSKGG